jgi:separase
MQGFLKDLSQYDGQDIADTSLLTSSFMMRVCDDLKLRLIANDSSKSVALDEITRSKYSSGMCNAEAYYQLGLTGLSSARQSGELHRLWTGNAVFHDGDDPPNANFDDAESKVDSYLLEARNFFQCALETAPPASHDLTRNILRCLALVMGPVEGESETGLTTASLIHMSVGGCSRNIVQNELLKGTLQELFQDFEDESLDYSARMKSFGLLLLRSGKSIPTNWNISTLASCPTGELLLSSIYTFVDDDGEKRIKISNVCIFPAFGTAPDESSWIGIHTDILHPFDKIIERSQNQLHGLTEDVQDTQYDENSSRREWWKERHTCDTDLQKLLSHVEREYFSHEPVRQCLIPDHLFCSARQSSSDDDDDENSDCSDLGPGKLESMFDAAHCNVSRVPKFDRERQQLILMKLTVAAIKSKLVSFGVLESTTKKKNKSELIDLLLSNMEITQHEEEENSLIDSATMNRADTYSNDANSDQIRIEEEPCTILILDEHLQRFPVESMDLFSNVAITRVPSLAFVFALLLECEMKHHSTAVKLPVVDPMQVKYVVDPESNLTETASTLGTALTLLSNTYGWKWDGVAGQMPSSEFMSQALTTDNGLYLYCGHGGGEKAFSRLQVEGLMNIRKDGIRGCRAPVVLMGCSSGKLQSVNTPKSISSSYYTMHYEPEGIALSYLFAGAPCVVGNLWDVTDRDIDRYCLTLMEDFFQSQTDTNNCQTSPSLAKCVAKARRACKLRFIVGSAPVCYGLPVTCIQNKTVTAGTTNK